MATFVDIHAIQSVGPNNLNRDLNGSPKTATFGGVRRARVSSQAWKRPMRLDFQERYSPENLGIRTARVVELLSEEIARQDPELQDQAVDIALAVFDAVGIKIAKPKAKKGEDIAVQDMVSQYLVFLSTAQVEAAAATAIAAYDQGGETGVKAAKRQLKKDLNADLSVDLALFGRMVAEDADLNVDASCQVAHALSTHQVGTEFDFFTAVDDVKAADEETDAGAGMMGNVEFDAATFYRYATVNATALARQLGSDEAATKAIEGFLDVFVTSMPTGKQNTFAAHSLPSLVAVAVRTDRPVSWVGAFERPVYPRRHPDAPTDGYGIESERRMLKHGASLDATYGGPVGETLVLKTNEDLDAPALLSGADVVPTLKDLEARVGEAVSSQLAEAKAEQA